MMVNHASTGARRPDDRRGDAAGLDEAVPRRIAKPATMPLRPFLAVGLVAVALATGPAPAFADGPRCDARPLGQLTVATLDNVPFVTVSANGRPVTLVLDTGAERTVFDPAVAERIGARPPRVEFDRHLHGIAGSLTTREVELQSLSAGEVSIPWHRVVVAPVTTAKVFPVPFDGLLGDDVLSGFDIDLDLPHQRLVFYEKRACTTGPPWAGPYTAISTGQSRAEHLFFPVRLDGREMPAIIDTGAQMTTVAKWAARALGLTDALLGQDPPITTRGAAAELLGSRIHQFRQLEIGRQIIPRPKLVVSDIRLQDAAAVLGIDLLESRRLYMSYASLEIFLSE